MASRARELARTEVLSRITTRVRPRRASRTNGGAGAAPQASSCSTPQRHQATHPATRHCRGRIALGNDESEDREHEPCAARLDPQRTRRTDYVLVLASPVLASLRQQLGGGHTRLALQDNYPENYPENYHSR